MAYTNEQLQKIYNELEAMSRHTGHPMISMEELTAYLEAKPKEMDKDSFISNYKTKSNIKKMMMEDLGGAENLKDVFGELKEASEQELKSIAQAAQQKEKKLMNDMERRKIKDAQEKLKEVGDKQLKAEAKRRGTDGRERLPYKPAAERKQHQGRGYWNPLRFLLAGTNFGSHAERHAEAEYPETLGVAMRAHTSESKDIQYRTPDGMLKGHTYVPTNPSGKVVLYFGGSHAPGATSIQNTAKYFESGATVVHFDPRGFGKSESLDKDDKKIGTKFSEESMYKDAMEMYRYVINEMHVKPENVILHGYSLGGALASRLAADISEKNQIADTKLMQTQGKHLPENMRLGGIVLQSPIDSNYNAAKRMVGIPGLGSIAGSLAWTGNGGFNTKSHMERLCKHDPNIPVLYTGGTRSWGDHLSPEITKIDKNPNAQFKNVNTSLYEGSHNTPMKEEQGFVSVVVLKGG